MTSAVCDYETDQLDRLATVGLTLAVDTEFEGGWTITSQFTCRDCEGRIRAQIYRLRGVEEPLDFSLEQSFGGLEQNDKWPRNVGAGILTPELSPFVVVRDLLSISAAYPVSRTEGHRRLRDSRFPITNGEWDRDRARWCIPQIDLVLVGHFLPADLARVFGHQFYSDHFAKATGVGDIELLSGRRLAFAQGSGTRTNDRPVVEFAATVDGRLYAIRLKTVDTTLPFGSGSLDRLCEAFLRAHKIDVFSLEEKANMLSTFRRRPREAFSYAIRDAVLVLRLYEEMSRQDREIFAAFDIPPLDVPAMRGTVGGRVASTTTGAIYSNQLRLQEFVLGLLEEGGS